MKKTLSSELITAGYEPLQHFRDPRARGRTRHKVWVGKANRDPLEQSDIEAISALMSELVPTAQPYGPQRGRFIEFVWTTEPGESSAVGTPLKARTISKLRRSEVK